MLCQFSLFYASVTTLDTLNVKKNVDSQVLRQVFPKCHMVSTTARLQRSSASTSALSFSNFRRYLKLILSYFSAIASHLYNVGLSKCFLVIDWGISVPSGTVGNLLLVSTFAMLLSCLGRLLSCLRISFSFSYLPNPPFCLAVGSADNNIIFLRHWLQTIQPC